MFRCPAGLFPFAHLSIFCRIIHPEFLRFLHFSGVFLPLCHPETVNLGQIMQTG